MWACGGIGDTVLEMGLLGLFESEVGIEGIDGIGRIVRILQQVNFALDRERKAMQMKVVWEYTPQLSERCSH